VYDIERYLNVRSAGGADFGPAGERLSFLIDTTGTSQVWSVDGPEVWPEQHTFFDERVTFASWSPERPELVFGMDEGGNERVQFHRLDATTGEITGLTRRPAAKHRWGGWDADGDRFAFASNRRDESVFDIYIQDRDATGDGAERVHEGDGWLSVAGWSPDDRRLLVHEAHSSFDHDLYVLDLETEGMRHLTPGDGEARYSSPEWGPDAESVYLVTDRESDTLRLERLALADDSFEVVESGGEWNVDGVVVDEETRRLVYTRNVEGYTEVTAGELVDDDRIDEFPEPELPEGVAGGVAFDPAGERFAITVSASTDNANVHVVDVESGETERWTRASTAGIPRETFVEPELVRYPTFDGRDIPAFFSTPSAAAPEDGYPVVVDIHGGPESQRRPSFRSVKQYLLEGGYAVMEPNVRGSSGYGKAYTHLDDVENRMDSVADVEGAVEWLADHPEVDADRVAAMGGSYGGFMVLAALTEYPDLWAAGVDVVGIANFVTFLENTGDWRRHLREAEYGSLEEDREQGVPVRKLLFDDEGHGFSKLENRIEAYGAVAEFLEEHV